MSSIGQIVRPLQILLVEDNPADVRLALEALEHEKFRNVISVATDGEEALAFLRREGRFVAAPRPDLVLLDLNLPKKDGREVLADMKRDENLRSIPVAVLTSSADEEDVFRAYELSDCYMTKPVGLEEFLKVVRAIQDFWVTIVKLPGDEPLGDKVIRALLVEDNPGDARLIEEMLKEGDETRIELKAVTLLSEAIQSAGGGACDVVLLDLSLPDSQGLSTFSQLHKAAPHVPVLIITGTADQTLAVKAVEDGAQDYIVKGSFDAGSLHRSIRYAIAREAMLAKAAQKPPGTAKGRAVAFIGAKGGVGTTTVVLSIAAAVAATKKSTIAAEIRPDYGTFSGQLRRTPATNLSGLAGADPEHISEDDLGEVLVGTPFGPRILFGPQAIDQFRDLDPKLVRALVDALSGMCDFLAIDLPTGNSKATEAALRRCDFVAIITEREHTAVASAKLMAELIRSWGVPPDHMGIILVNRSSVTTSMAAHEIKEQTGCTMIGLVPQAAESCMEAERHGLPLFAAEPNCVAASSIKDIAHKLTSETTLPTGF